MPTPRPGSSRRRDPKGGAKHKQERCASLLAPRRRVTVASPTLKGTKRSAVIFLGTTIAWILSSANRRHPPERGTGLPSAAEDD